jgi:hypothetical protein
MAEPWTFNFEPTDQGGIFTFSNNHITIAADTSFVVPPPVTVESVTLENHHGTVDLGITSVEVPPPVIEHLSGHFDLLI